MQPIRLERTAGRWRFRRHLLLLLPLCFAGYAWFGTAGLVPLLVWWWHVRPRDTRVPWQIDLDEVRSARFGAWRTLIEFRGRSRLEVFSDELAHSDLARLRRELKARLAEPDEPSV